MRFVIAWSILGLIVTIRAAPGIPDDSVQLQLPDDENSDKVRIAEVTELPLPITPPPDNHIETTDLSEPTETPTYDKPESTDLPAASTNPEASDLSVPVDVTALSIPNTVSDQPDNEIDKVDVTDLSDSNNFDLSNQPDDAGDVEERKILKKLKKLFKKLKFKGKLKGKVSISKVNLLNR